MVSLWLRRVALLLLVLPAIYAVAGLVGGALPAGGARPRPAEGITIWVESNGIHTGIVVPKVAAGIDWRDLARPEDLADPRYAAHDHLSFGWGDRTFYLETPRWRDVRPGTVVAAAVGSDHTLVHLDHVPRPVAGPDVRPVVLTLAEYRRLAAFIAATVVPDGERLHGYAGYDAFYAAHGRYDALHTCNEWIGTALRRAGVRMGRWTPFPGTVMQWL